MVYPPRNYCVSTFNFFKYLLLLDRDLWSTFHALYVIMIFYNVLLCYLLVDHNLWSTLHAIIVSPIFV